MSEVELRDLVMNYNKLKSVCKPLHTLYTRALHALSWENTQLTTCTLLLITVLLVYPAYLQFAVAAAMIGVFSFSYMNTMSQHHEEPFGINTLDPVDFINPIYYSLEPERSVESRDRTIKAYRCMLQEVDVCLKNILQIRERVIGLMSWQDFKETRSALVVIVSLILAPTVLPLNILLLFVVIYLFCCNPRCYSAVRRFLAEVDLRNIASAAPNSDRYESDDFDDSISEFTNSASSRCVPVQDSSGPIKEKKSEYLSGKSISRPCTNCSDRTAGGVMCGFCGCPYCLNCCSNTVTKAQLGVTNPDTKHYLVRVCAECAVYLPGTG